MEKLEQQKYKDEQKVKKARAALARVTQNGGITTLNRQILRQTYWPRGNRIGKEDFVSQVFHLASTSSNEGNGF